MSYVTKSTLNAVIDEIGLQQQKTNVKVQKNYEKTLENERRASALTETARNYAFKLDQQHRSELNRIFTDAKTHRDSLEGKIQRNTEERLKKIDVEKIVTDYHGDDLARIEKKIDEHRKGHNNGGNGCEFWDIACKFNKLKYEIGTAGLIAGGAIVGYVLLRRRLNR